MAQRTKIIHLNIILIGKTGHGKSATGNSILGRKAFKTSSKVTSETKYVTCAWAKHGQYKIKVVDGPGLEETNLDELNNNIHACNNMARAMVMCTHGIHAFVFVFKFGVKYTKEEKKAVSDLKQIFGDNYLKNYGIIVITGGDFFPGQMEADETPGKTFEEWYREQGGEFGDLIEECSPRVVLINNLSKSEDEKKRQRNELLSHARQLRKQNGCYTNKHFEAYAQVRNKFIKDTNQKILEETMQKRVDLLSAELGRLSIDSSLEDVDKIDARITDVYTEIRDEDLQEESLQQLIANLEKIRNTTGHCRRAIQENNPSEIKLNIKAISKHREELDKIREIPWGHIAVAIGIAISVAAVGTGIAAIGLGVAAVAGGVAAGASVAAVGADVVAVGASVGVAGAGVGGGVAAISAGVASVIGGVGTGVALVKASKDIIARGACSLGKVMLDAATSYLSKKSQ